MVTSISPPLGVQIVKPISCNLLPSSFQRDSFADGIANVQHGRGESSIPLDRNRPFIALNTSFLDVLGDTPSIRVIARQPGHSFAHEAGIYVPDSDSVWFTSNLLTTGGRRHVDISKVDLNTHKVEKVSIPEISMGNGGCLYDKRVLFCDQGTMDSPSQLVLVDPNDPSKSHPIVNSFHGRPFNSLNDVITLAHPHDPSRSLIYFTDPTYGYEQGYRLKPQLPPQVYCFDPHSGDLRAIADGFDHPNGICFSPKGDVCYITDTGHIHGSGVIDPSKTSTIYAFDVRWHGEGAEAIPQLHNRRLFAFVDSGVPDGIKCDPAGNVYSGCGDGLHIWNASGRLIGKILFEFCARGSKGGCANFCFVPGGRVLCLAEDTIYLVEGLAI